MLIAPPILDRIGQRLRPVGVDAIRECPPVGIYTLAGALRRDGHEVVLEDLVALGRGDLCPTDLDGCGLVGISTTSLSWPTALDLVRAIRRRRPELPVACGGIHATLFDRYLVERHRVAFVVRGEGEVALPALCRALESGTALGDVPNLSWSDGGLFVRNALGPKLSPEEIAAFPPPDYAEVPDQAYLGLSLESSRGCTFDCSFCSTPYRKTWRGIPPEPFVDRLEAVLAHVRRTRGGYVHVIDDEFTLDPHRAIAITEVLRRRGLSPTLHYDARARDLLTPGLVEGLKEFTGTFLLGAECGYDEGLRRIGKGSTCAVLEEAARILAREGIAERVDYSFMIGLPWETRAEAEETIRFAARLHATYGVHVIMQWYRQIPGSRLWDDARREGLVHEAMYDDYGFFRDLNLFRTSCRLSPREVWEVSEMAQQLDAVSRLHGKARPCFDYYFPLPIAIGFPLDFLDHGDAGLGNLRAIAYAGRR